jgi:hypothetical protein
MTNYHLKLSAKPLPSKPWQEGKEKRKKLLAQVRARKREVYKRLWQKAYKTLRTA